MLTRMQETKRLLACAGAALVLLHCSQDSGPRLSADALLAEGGVLEDGALSGDAVEDARDAAEAAKDDAGNLGSADGGGSWVYSCSPVGTAYTDGFFTLHSFSGKLYAGLFGYGHEAESMIYRYPPFELPSPGLTGVSESVCAMAVFEGYLYANTEMSGDIFRTANGADWEQVHNGGSGTIGCGLAEFEGSLYAINYRNSQNDHGLILRQEGSGWTTVYDSGQAPLYLRELVAYNGTLYAFGVQERQGKMLSSRDGTTWQLQDVNNRYFRGHVWNGYLWLGSTDSSANGEVGVFRFDGAEFVKTHASSKRYITDLKDLDGQLFASTSNGWKDDTGPSSLLMSPDGESTWEIICTFPDTAVWNMAVFNNELYLGTWSYGGHGKLYKVMRTRDSVEPAAR